MRASSLLAVSCLCLATATAGAGEPAQLARTTHVYKTAGTLVREWGRRGIGGPGDKPARFARPHGMALDSKGYFYVADAGNQRVQKFELPAP